MIQMIKKYWVLLVVVFTIAAISGCDNSQEIEKQAIAAELTRINYNDRFVSMDDAVAFLYNQRHDYLQANKDLIIDDQKNFIYTSLLLINNGLSSRLNGRLAASDSILDYAQIFASFFNEAFDDRFLQEELAFSRGLNVERLQVRQDLKTLVYKAGKSGDKLKAYKDVLNMARSLQYPKLQVEIIRKIQFNLNNENKYEQSRLYGEEGLKIARQINYRSELCKVLRNLGNSYINLGDYHKAIKSFDEGIFFARSLRDKEMEMKLIARKGIAHAEQGEYNNAMAAYNEAIRLATNYADSSYFSKLYNDRGLSLMWMGLYDSAKVDYFRALELLKASTIGDSVKSDEAEEVANTTSNLGILYQWVGNMKAADTTLNNAYRIIRQIDEKDDFVNMLDNLGDLYQEMDSLALALSYYQMASATIKSCKEDNTNLPKKLEAEVFISWGNACLRKAEALNQKGDKQTGNEFLRLALNNFDAAYAVIGDLDVPSEIARALIGQGKAYRLGSQYQAAMQVLRKGIAIAKELRDPLVLLDAQFTLSQVYQNRGNIEGARQALEVAIETIETSGENVSGKNRLTFFAKRQDIYDEMILFQMRNDRFEEAFLYSESSRARSLIDVIEEKNLWQANGQPVSSISDIQKSLGEQVQLVEYKVTRNELLIFVVTGNTFYAPIRISVSRDSLSKWVIDYRKAIGADENNAFEAEVKFIAKERFLSGAKAGQRLHEYLIKPIEEDYLDKEKVLYIVPDEVLSYVPFDGLNTTKSGNHFLVEDYTIAYSPSAIVLKYILDHPRVPVSPEEDLFFGVANPTFDLPGTEKEIDNSSRYFKKKPEILRTYNSNEAKVMEALRRSPAVIQFSTHAFTSSDNSNYHSIVVGAKMNRQSAEEFVKLRNHSKAEPLLNDDQLMVYEIAQLDLSKTKFVNLPGCNTGGGLLYRGEGVVGITTAFMKAGVPSVMSTLWKIRDEASSELMTAFFANWMGKDSVSRAEALRQAKLEMIVDMRAKNGYPFPHRWAAFVINGDSF